MNEQAEQNSTSLRRSNRISQTNLLSTQNMASNENSEQDAEIKQYSVNKLKSLLKKLDSCTKTDLDYELKPGNNLVLQFSTVAYELAKQTIVQKTDSMKTQYEVQIEPSKDRQGARVGTRYKIGKKRKDSYQKQYMLYTVNCYDTQSSMLINGRNLDIFETDLFQHIKDNIESNKAQIQSANMHTKDVISSALQNFEQLPGAKENQTAITSSKHSETNSSTSSSKTLAKNGGTQHTSHLSQIKRVHNQADTMNSQETSMLPIEAGPNLHDDKKDSEGEEVTYLCPICHKSSQTQSIACDNCDEWIHFHCIGIPQHKEADMEEVPYICSQCNAEAQYLDSAHKPEPPSGNIDQINDTVEKENHPTPETTVLANPASIETPLTFSDETQVKGFSSEIPMQTSNSTAINLKPTQKPHQMGTGSTQKKAELAHNTAQHSQDSCDSASKKQLEPDVENNNDKITASTLRQTKTKKKPDIEQKQYTTSLEKTIREQEKTIKLLQRNLELLDQKCISNTEPQNSQNRDSAKNSDQSTHEQLLETRLRILENQNIQNLSIFTALTTTMALQNANQRCNQPCQMHTCVGNPHVNTGLQNWHGIPEGNQIFGQPNYYQGPQIPVGPYRIYQGQNQAPYGISQPGHAQLPQGVANLRPQPPHWPPQHMPPQVRPQGSNLLGQNIRYPNGPPPFPFTPDMPWPNGKPNTQSGVTFFPPPYNGINPQNRPGPTNPPPGYSFQQQPHINHPNTGIPGCLNIPQNLGSKQNPPVQQTPFVREPPRIPESQGLLPDCNSDTIRGGTINPHGNLVKSDTRQVPVGPVDIRPRSCREDETAPVSGNSWGKGPDRSVDIGPWSVRGQSKSVENMKVQVLGGPVDTGPWSIRQNNLDQNMEDTMCMENPKGEGSLRLVDVRPQSVGEHCHHALLTPISTKRKTTEKIDHHIDMSNPQKTSFLEIPGLLRRPPDKTAQTTVRHS